MFTRARPDDGIARPAPAATAPGSAAATPGSAARKSAARRRPMGRATSEACARPRKERIGWPADPAEENYGTQPPRAGFPSAEACHALRPASVSTQNEERPAERSRTPAGTTAPSYVPEAAWWRSSARVAWTRRGGGASEEPPTRRR